MDNIPMLIGSRIRLYRQAKNISLSELSERIHKSKSTLSKYENGEISMDVETLFDVANALGIAPTQLVNVSEDKKERKKGEVSNVRRKYMYIYDGRSGKINYSVLEIYENGEEYQPVTLFYNIPSFDKYDKCRALYYCMVYEHDFVTNYSLQNQSNEMESIFMCTIKPFELSERRIGLLSGISARNLLPASCKFVLADSILKEDDELKSTLMLSKEDLRLIKRFNMFVIDQMV